MARESRIGMEVFKAVTRSIAHSRDLDDMTHHLVQLLTAALGIKGCAIFVLNPRTQELEVLASCGLSPEYLAKGPLRAPQSIAGTFRGETVVIADVSRDDRLQYPAEARKEGIAALVSLPATFRDEVIGVLRLYHFETWDVSEADLDSLRTLADTIGMAISCTRFQNALQAMAEVLGEALPAR